MESQNPQVEVATSLLKDIRHNINEYIVGQNHLVDSLLIALLTDGHVLLEGLPGLAKTLSVKTLAGLLHANFKRIQFTPDLLPSDLVGTMILDPKTQSYSPKKGPIFCNFLLADEINRAPAKVQSALLEAMGEKQVTLGEVTYTLENPFLVLATQNPIEQEGTFPLPEAQIDRFMLKVKLTYPKKEEELKILNLYGENKNPSVPAKYQLNAIQEAKNALSKVHVDDRIKNYLVKLVFATRNGVELTQQEANLNRLQEFRKQLKFGVSPRASLYWYQAAKAQALLEGRSFVLPDDVKKVAYDILRHRLLLTFEAEVSQILPENLIQLLLETVVVP